MIFHSFSSQLTCAVRVYDFGRERRRFQSHSDQDWKSLTAQPAVNGYLAIVWRRKEPIARRRSDAAVQNRIWTPLHLPYFYESRKGETNFVLPLISL